MKVSAHSPEIKAGAFVLIALIVLIAGSLWIAGGPVLGTRRVSYRVVMDDSGGLEPGDRVRIAGVSVGRVQHLELRTDTHPPVSVLVSIRREFVVRADSTARVATSGLMGQAYLDVDVGSPSAPPLLEGQEIRGVPTPGIEAALGKVVDLSATAEDLMAQTASVLDKVTSEVGPLLANLNVMLSESNAENVQQILSNLRATSEDLAPRVTSLLERLDSISGQIESGVESLPELTDKFAAIVDDLQRALGPDGSRLTGVLVSAETSLNSADDALALVGDNRTEILATIRDLRDVVSNLKAFSQQVKERPFSLVRIRAERDRKPGRAVRGDGR